jgi:uncharacterized protein with NAD-binding domain and iron-sulfur cluster/nitrite reductase/ring-hydroxylating ferredoxin subunit
MLKLVPTAGAGEGWEIARECADPRQELLRLLHEACQVEHSLMLQYLYAAFSVKPRYARLLVGPTAAGHDALLGVAIEEMFHLRDVNRILVELGGQPSLMHQDFPYEPGIYPFPMTLEPLSRASVARYVFAEAPRGALAVGNAAAEPDENFARAILELLPHEQPLNHVGSLYRTVLALFDELDGFEASETLARSRRTIEQIRLQGEHEHFAFFRELFLGTHGAFTGVVDPWGKPDAEEYPAVALPVNPSATATPPRGLAGTNVEIARLGNLTYWALLLVLDLGYRTPGRRPLAHASSVLMTDVLLPTARILAAAESGVPFDTPPTEYTPGSDAGANAASAREVLHAARRLAATLTTALGDAATSVSYMLRAAEEAVTAWKPTSRRDRRDLVAPQVLVVGSGPAGLAAGSALAQRGLVVRIVEDRTIAGGKTDSTPEGGRNKEHGVHGWWPGYRNFDRLLSDAGVDLATALRPARGGAVVTGPERFDMLHDLPFPPPSPLFVFYHFLRMSFLDLRDLLGCIPFAIHVLAFDHQRDYERYDVFSLSDLAHRLGLSSAFQKYVLRPFTLSFDYSPPDRVSASSILSALQFYVLPSQRELVPRWVNGVPWDRILDPILRSIEDKGGQVEPGRTLESVVIRDGAVVGGVLRGIDRDAAVGDEVVASMPESAVPAGTMRAVDSAAGPLLVGAIDGQVRAYLAKCTHQGGPLEWYRGEIVCQRHGGRFSGNGTVIRPPATRALTSLAVRRTGSTIEILGRSTLREIACQHIILATDVTGAKAVLGRSAGVPTELMRRMERLRTTPVVVVRLWFRPETYVPRDMETAVLPDARIADIYFHLNAIHPVYDAEGVVIEIHASDPDAAWCDRSDEEILEAVFADLRLLSRKLTRDKLRDPGAYEIRRHRSVFTFYAPCEVRNRPDADSGVQGLHLAGDWTRAHWSVWMMERAVVSGLEAANRVLEAHRLPPVSVLRPPPEGFLLRVCRRFARAARQLVWGGPPSALESSRREVKSDSRRLRTARRSRPGVPRTPRSSPRSRRSSSRTRT